MARDFKEQLDSLTAKLTVVSQRYAKLDECYLAAKQEISDLKAQIIVRDREIDRLRLDNEFLTVASTLGADREKLVATRDMIADLMRDIDRCIADLLQ